MKNFKKTMMGFAAVALVVAFSAFTSQQKLAPGDYRFYNKTQNIHSTNPDDYVFRAEQDECLESGNVCSEVWNIGSSTPQPNDGDLLSDYPTQNYIGVVEAGTYTGD